MSQAPHLRGCDLEQFTSLIKCAIVSGDTGGGSFAVVYVIIIFSNGDDPGVGV